jgi:hypothetical protein
MVQVLNTGNDTLIKAATGSIALAGGIGLLSASMYALAPALLITTPALAAFGFAAALITPMTCNLSSLFASLGEFNFYAIRSHITAVSASMVSLGG